MSNTLKELTYLKKVLDVKKQIRLYDSYLIQECLMFDKRMQIIKEIGRLNMLMESIESLPIKCYDDTYIEYHIEIPSKMNKM